VLLNCNVGIKVDFSVQGLTDDQTAAISSDLDAQLSAGVGFPKASSVYGSSVAPVVEGGNSIRL
jgi:hypothetical protein